MNGLFKRLDDKLEIDKQDEGISALHVAELPPDLRKLMRFLLREVEMTRTDIGEAAAKIPELETMSAAELDKALDTLRRQNWLIRRGEGERVRYQVNLRRKAGSRINSGIWGKLEERIERGKAVEGEEDTEQGSKGD